MDLKFKAGDHVYVKGWGHGLVVIAHVDTFVTVQLPGYDEIWKFPAFMVSIQYSPLTLHPTSMVHVPGAS